MTNNFFEIDNVSFAAGGKNKVNNVSLKIDLLIIEIIQVSKQGIKLVKITKLN